MHMSQEKYYNLRKVKDLPTLKPNNKVYVQRFPGSIWHPGIVISQNRNRLYKVKLINGSILNRNRRFYQIYWT